MGPIGLWELWALVLLLFVFVMGRIFTGTDSIEIGGIVIGFGIVIRC